MKLKKIWLKLIIFSTFFTYVPNLFAFGFGTALITSGLGLILYDIAPYISDLWQTDSDNDTFSIGRPTEITIYKNKYIKVNSNNFLQKPEPWPLSLNHLNDNNFNDSNSYKNLLLNHKLKLLGISLFMYGIFWKKLINSYNKIEKKQKWSTWKNHITIEMLYETPENQILKELQTAMDKNYSQNIDSSMEVLSKFVKDINQEIKILQHFVNFYSILKKTCLSIFFPNFDEEMLESQEKIERLFYFKELVSEVIRKKSIATS